MIATANSMVSTLPRGGGKNGSSGPASAQGPKTRKRKPWKPGNRDHEIYVSVRFQGMGQAQVASQYDISQATVSRTLERYEKWQAHAQPGEDGSLTHAEQLRAQRWLTYERNDRILGSCLRMAARFLRLAFKINMEQLKLTEREPLAPLPPLTEEENAAYEAESAALWTEPDEAQRQRNENAGIKDRIDSEVAAAVAAEVARRLGPRPTDGPGARGRGPGTRAGRDATA